MATKKATKKTSKKKEVVTEVEKETVVEEVEAERVTQGNKKPLHSVILPNGKVLRLTDKEFEEFKS